MTSSDGNIFCVTGLLCGNSSATGGFPTQRPVTRSFDVFFDMRLDQRLSTQCRRRWFETPSRSLWRQYNALGQWHGCSVPNQINLNLSVKPLLLSFWKGGPSLLGLYLVFFLIVVTWWRHQMETFSALLAIVAGNSSVPIEFPAQRPVTRSFDVSFDLRRNKRLNKQSWGWWFETLLSPLWRQRNASSFNHVLQGWFT